MFRHLKHFALAALAAASLFTAGTAYAAFPERPITLIVPWAAGGGTDAVARQVALMLERDFKQPVNVVNRTGGSGVVGHQAIATSAPDGYTFGLITLEINLMHWVGLTDLTFEKYTPLALVNQDFAAIHVKADSPYKSVKELFAQIKANPNKLTASGTGQGGSWHVALAGLMQADGVSPGAIRWVPSTGAATALTDLAAGGIDFVACSMPEAEALIKAGRVRSLVFFSEKRAPNFPDVPTTEEATGSEMAQGRVARLCGAERPAEGDRRAVRDRDQEGLGQRGVSRVHDEARLRHDLSGFGEVRRVHEGRQRGQRRRAEVAGAGEVGARLRPAHLSGSGRLPV